MKGINIFLADGFEDIEALAPCDILRRAGLQVRLISISDRLEVRSAHGVTLLADCLLDDVLNEPYGRPGAEDVLIFPGGMPGAANLAACEMQTQYDMGGSVAAICAAPGLVLSQLRGIAGREVTGYDGFEDRLEAAGAVFTPRGAVRSGRIFSGRGPGHACDFALESVRSIDPARAQAVWAGMKLPTLD